MFILIKDKRKISRYDLSQVFTIQYKGIRIYEKKDAAYISLKDGYSLKSGEMTARISENAYYVNTPEAYGEIEVYIYDNDEGIDDFIFAQKSDFLIASDPRSGVICFDPNLQDKYLYFKDGGIRSNFDVVVDGRRYEEGLIENGSRVEFLGIIFYVFADFIYINRFLNEIHLPPYQLKASRLVYKRQLPRSYRLLAESYEQLQIEELVKYEPLNSEVRNDIFRSVLPSLIMSFGILSISMLNLYNNYLNSNLNYLQAAAYIISPLLMLVSGVLIPLIYARKEKKETAKEKEDHIQEYLTYLQEYRSRLEANLDSYTRSQQKHLFSIDEDHPFFYLSDQDEDFLSLSLGTCTIREEFSYEKSGEQRIDHELACIADRLKNIDEQPLLLKVAEKRFITIVAKESQIAYFFDSILLELAYKHHYQDLQLAIYSEDKDSLGRYYDLPHLFTSNRRLTLNCSADLQQLDQMALEKETVLLVKDGVVHPLSNPKIHVICFANEREKVAKDSDCIVEYLNNVAYLHDPWRRRFQYRQVAYDFKKLFYQLGKFNSYLEEDGERSFKELFEDFDIKESYQKIHHDLRADFAYCDQELLSFDLHENNQGPHGLIAGTTGSGKSELIVSLLLSLCIRYAPDYLNILLIDYKGGGIKESLSYENQPLPHITAAISNLENNVLERFIIALNNECLERERLFKQLSEACGVSIMDLDDYLENAYAEYGLPKIAHLLIVVDEFAQLRKEDPEQIKALISISRIGRSLGLHLLLATQKPAGNIDDEIFSNSRFKISLKVYEEKDSQDVIRSKKAAYLSRPGSFYLRIDESLIKAQSIYAKKDYTDQEPYEAGIYDGRLQIAQSRKIVSKSGISQAAYFVKKINGICKQLALPQRDFTFMPPDKLKRQDLQEEGFILGVSDDYLRKENRILHYPLNSDLLICSSRPKELAIFLNTLHQQQRQTIVIGSRRYHNTVISDSLLYEEEEDIFFLYEQLLKKDYDLCLLIEDLSCLFSYHEQHQEYLYRLLKRSEYLSMNIVALSRQAQLPFRIINCFRKRFMIEAADVNDVSYFYGGRLEYKGSSFYYDQQIIPFVPLEEEELITAESLFKPFIRRIPEIIKAEKNEKGMLIGYDLQEKEKVFAQDVYVTAYDEELLDVYQQAYGEELQISLYDSKQSIRKDILWLGPGLFSQRLFVSGSREDLKADEGVYVHKGKKIYVRSLNNA